MTIRPCNQCGRCCYETPCQIGIDYANSTEGQPCNALVREGEVYHCHIYRHPEMYVDLEWAMGDKAIEQRYIENFSKLIKERFKPMMVNQCDSVYGQGEDDRRIPVHQLPTRGTQ